MNLLNNIFSNDDIKIRDNNKWCMIVSLILIMILGSLLLLKKDNYYVNTYSVIDNNIILVVEKEKINDVQNNRKIIIDSIENGYSINNITPTGNSCLVNISLKTALINISGGTYKIYLGKERLFDYIIRIMRK